MFICGSYSTYRPACPLADAQVSVYPAEVIPGNARSQVMRDVRSVMGCQGVPRIDHLVE